MKAIAAQAKAKSAKVAKPVPHKPSLAQIKLDKAAAQEGDKLLAEDSKVAAEELTSPESTVHKMLSKDQKAVTARDAAFQAHLKKMAATDKSQEAKDSAREKASEKKVNGYVTSSDQAFESEFFPLVQCLPHLLCFGSVLHLCLPHRVGTKRPRGCLVCACEYRGYNVQMSLKGQCVCVCVCACISWVYL